MIKILLMLFWFVVLTLLFQVALAYITDPANIRVEVSLKYWWLYVIVFCDSAIITYLDTED